MQNKNNSDNAKKKNCLIFDISKYYEVKQKESNFAEVSTFIFEFLYTFV